MTLGTVSTWGPFYLKLTSSNLVQITIDQNIQWLRLKLVGISSVSNYQVYRLVSCDTIVDNVMRGQGRN